MSAVHAPCRIVRADGAPCPTRAEYRAVLVLRSDRADPGSRGLLDVCVCLGCRVGLGVANFLPATEEGWAQMEVQAGKPLDRALVALDWIGVGSKASRSYAALRGGHRIVTRNPEKFPGEPKTGGEGDDDGGAG